MGILSGEREVFIRNIWEVLWRNYYVCWNLKTGKIFSVGIRGEGSLERREGIVSND